MYGAKSENQARDIFDHSRTPLVEVCDNQLFMKLISPHTHWVLPNLPHSCDPRRKE